MTKISAFDHRLASRLPITQGLLLSSNLVVHANVTRVVLHGSRGLAGGYRVDSDIDLSLLVDTGALTVQAELERLLQDVLHSTLSAWHGSVELDLAAIFDCRGCGLKCFDQIAYNDQFCALGGVDCFGLYKIQKGFDGFVTDAGIQVRRMYPCLRIWQRP